MIVHRWRLRYVLTPLLFLLGCGGSPTTPTPPAPPPPVNATLNPGAYSLSVSQGPPAPGGGTPINWVCLTVGTAPTSVQVPVTLEGEGSNYRARAVSGTLLLDMTVSGSAVSGTVRGFADDPTGGFSLSVQESEPASVSGLVATNGIGVSGTLVAGKLTLHGPQGYGGCSPSNWLLMPR